MARSLNGHPLWWILLRDTLLLAVGLGGIIFEHSTIRDARPLLITADLVLIGMIPLNHLALRVRSPLRPTDDTPTVERK